jgi:hypothetical protein
MSRRLTAGVLLLSTLLVTISCVPPPRVTGSETAAGRPSAEATANALFVPPSPETIPSDLRGEQIRLGYKIIVDTQEYGKRYVGNNSLHQLSSGCRAQSKFRVIRRNLHPLSTVSGTSWPTDDSGRSSQRVFRTRYERETSAAGQYQAHRHRRVHRVVVTECVARQCGPVARNPTPGLAPSARPS